MMSRQKKICLYFLFHILKLSLECEDTPTSLIRYKVSNDKLNELEIEGNILVTSSESFLVQVDLLNNTKLCSKMLSISYSVRSIWFSADNIIEIESELLKNQKVSENLYITSGKIKTLKKHTFKDLELSVLGLFDNEIVTIEEEAFVGLPFVSLINLSHNKIEWIHLRSFVDVPELISLDLSHNNISRIEKHFFHFCQQNSLNIKLSYNRIESVDDEAFAGSRSAAIDLDLEENRIELLSF
jgi:Leucine-rich repeat (LRR) protein